MLEENNYVRCLIINFTKAIDSVYQVILSAKLIKLDSPSFVIKWICSFLSGRSQQCKISGVFSDVSNI